MTSFVRNQTADNVALDFSLFTAVGLEDLTLVDKTDILERFTEELQLRVGTVLAEQLGETELLGAEKAIDTGDEETMAWLEAHFPGYKVAVRAQYLALLAELRLLAPRIRQSAQDNGKQEEKT